MLSAILSTRKGAVNKKGQQPLSFFHTTLPLYSFPTTVASWLFLKHAKLVPGLRAFDWLFALSGMFFTGLSVSPQILEQKPHSDSSISLTSLLKAVSQSLSTTMLCFIFLTEFEYLRLSLFTYLLSLSPTQNVSSMRIGI